MHRSKSNKRKQREYSSDFSDSDSEDDYASIKKQLKLLSDKVTRLKKSRQREESSEAESPEEVAESTGNTNQTEPPPGTVDYDFSDNEKEEEINNSNEIEPEILTLLGGKTDANKDKSEDINGNVAQIWQKILQDGLNSETVSELVKKYPPSGNLSLAAAPKLNMEVLAVLTEQHRQRDQRLSGLQNQMGAALTAVGRALTILLQEKGEDRTRLLIELLSDAGRLLSEIHHEESCCRRTLVSSDIDRQFRATLSDVSVDGWLFGSDLGERVKAARDLDKLSSELKPKANTRTNNHLNVKSLPRVTYKGYRGRPMTTQKLQHYKGRSPRGGDFRHMTRQPHLIRRSRAPKQIQARQQ